MALLMLVPFLPIEGNYKLLTVLSGSMEPAMKVGSLVAVVPADEYKKGEVITFNAGSQIKATVTHRIVEVKTINDKTVYITKGDANNAADNEPVDAARVIGKVLFDIPWLGYAVATVRKPYGFAALILFPSALIIFGEIKKIISEVKKTKFG